VRRGTYSIVARDAATGELGVAVQSHWFSVGSVVPWAQAGIGAVATQSVVEPGYGPGMLARLAAGDEPRPALEHLLAADELARFRQVAAVGADGAVACHTGEDCIPYAGDTSGDGFSAQANMMAAPGVPEAMAGGFADADGVLAPRLLAALEAADAAGGDARGRQSAALVVVPHEGSAWERSCELRVEDHPDPLGELARLLPLHRAYALATEADELAGEGRHAEAGELYREAAAIAPDNHELLFWSGLALVLAGDDEEGLARVRRAIELHPGWADLLPRLSEEIAPAAPRVCEALGISR
jgi:uncharacterized Ntn-hydrolase superfamily protein